MCLNIRQAYFFKMGVSGQALFIARGLKSELVDALGRGERAPALDRDDEVAEPQNRRAEVIVR